MQTTGVSPVNIPQIWWDDENGCSNIVAKWIHWDDEWSSATSMFTPSTKLQLHHPTIITPSAHQKSTWNCQLFIQLLVAHWLNLSRIDMGVIQPNIVNLNNENIINHRRWWSERLCSTILHWIFTTIMNSHEPSSSTINHHEPWFRMITHHLPAISCMIFPVFRPAWCLSNHRIAFSSVGWPLPQLVSSFRI